MVKSEVHVRDLALHHLHDLTNESANAVCPIVCCIGLHLIDSCSCTFIPSLVTAPVTRSSNKESDEKGYHTTGSELMIFSRSVASTFVLASGESMCCLVVVVCDRIVPFSDVTGIDMVQ